MARNMKMQNWGVGTMAGFGVLAAWFVACAGTDVPPVDDELRQDIADEYPDGSGGQQAVAGAGGAVPSGGAAGTRGEPAGGGAAGAGGGDVAAAGAGGGGGGGVVCEAYTTIIVPRCGNPTCHDSGSAQGAFAIEGDEAGLAEFIDRESTFSNCNGLFIDSSNTENSLLLTKLANPVPTGCGQLQMPLTGDFLTPEEITCMEDWLTQFAQ
jgi:hypothetical protein